MREIMFSEGDERRRLWIYDCAYCGKGKVIVEKKVISNTGYGSHIDYHTIGFLAGGKKHGGYHLCDSCANFDKRVSDLKKLERKIKTAESRIEDFKKLMEDFTVTHKPRRDE